MKQVLSNMIFSQSRPTGMKF